MPKYLKWILIELAIFAIFITGAVLVVTRYIQPYMNAQTNMPKNGGFVFRQMEDGNLEISWPKAERADYYIFQAYQLPNDGQFSYQNDAGELVYEKTVMDGCAVTLRADAYSGNMLFRVSSACDYEIEQIQQTRLSDDVLELVTKFDAPSIENVTCTTDPEKQTAYFRFEMMDATSCHVSLLDASGKTQYVKTVNTNAATITFGADGELPMPAFGEKVELHFAVTREAEGIHYYSTDYATFSVERSMLVPSDILLECFYEDDSCWLNWQTEECDYYEIQVLDPATGNWDVLGIMGQDQNVCNLIGSVEALTVVRVAAAYEKETKDENGEPLVTVKYRSISNEISVLPDADRPQAQKTQIQVGLGWDDADNKDAIRPDSVVIRLFADGTEVANAVLSELSGWSYVFADMPVYHAGKKIAYTVTVDEIQGYTANVSGNMEEGFTIVNFHEPRPDSWTGTVTINNLRIRSGAGYNYSILGYLQMGDRVEILEIIQVGADLWGRIENGWVAMEFILLDNVHQKVSVTIDNLRIREGAGYNYAIMGYLQTNDQVELLEVIFVDGTLWGRIEQGWICLDYVVVIEMMPE